MTGSGQKMSIDMHPRVPLNAAIIQDSYGVPFRNTFVHPKFKAPLFYSNIALIELNGNVGDVGKSPACFSEGASDITGMDATYEGFGSSDRKTLKNEPVAIIANDLCDEILDSNNTHHLINKAKLKGTLSKGANDEIVCTMGKYVGATDKYTVSME